MDRKETWLWFVTFTKRPFSSSVVLSGTLFAAPLISVIAVKSIIHPASEVGDSQRCLVSWRGWYTHKSITHCRPIVVGGKNQRMLSERLPSDRHTVFRGQDLPANTVPTLTEGESKSEREAREGNCRTFSHSLKHYSGTNDSMCSVC